MPDRLQVRARPRPRRSRDDDWGRRYGRPVRLGKNPTRPRTRISEAGADACRLPGHLAASCPDLLRGPRVRALRQILVQNYHWDPAGRLRWRDDEGDAGLPPSAARIVSPYDPAARYSRRGQVTRWAGYLAHVTETCAEDAPNVITDVATMPATSDDRQALAGIHARLDHGPGQVRDLLQQVPEDRDLICLLHVHRELGGGGAVVPDPGQQHRGAAAAGGAAHRLPVDPQVAAHAGQRARPGCGPRAQCVVVLALVAAGQAAAERGGVRAARLSLPCPAGRPA